MVCYSPRMSRQAEGAKSFTLSHTPHSTPLPLSARARLLPVAFRRRPSAPFPPPFPGCSPSSRDPRPPVLGRSSEDWFLAETRTARGRKGGGGFLSASELNLNLPADRLRSPSFSSAGKGPPAVPARWSDRRQLIPAPWRKGRPGRRSAERKATPLSSHAESRET